MTFDKWFKEQTRLVQIILLIIPFVGWVVELLVRISALLRKNTNTNILGLVIYIFFGGFIVLEVLDIICIVSDKNLFLME